MKIFNLLFLVIIIQSCGQIGDNELIEENKSSIQKDSVILEKQIDYTDLHNVLTGQWRTEGNDGVVPNIIEFDSSHMKFKFWLTEDQRPTNSSGLFKIVSDSLLHMEYLDYIGTVDYSFDSISQNYIEITSLGINAGNLIYRRVSEPDSSLKE